MLFPCVVFPHLDLDWLSMRLFGILVVFSIILGARILRRRILREQLDAVRADQLVTWMLVSGFITAHLCDRFVYHRPLEALADPIGILEIWTNHASIGGFAGAVFGAWLYLRRHPLAPYTWRYLDAVAYSFVFAWIVGRLGCAFAFDHPGRATTFFLGQVYRDGTIRHNLGLYEAIFFVPVATVYLVLGRTRRAPGLLVALACLIYAPFRFLADFLRIVDMRYDGLTPGQWGSLALLLVGIVIARNCSRARDRMAAPL